MADNDALNETLANEGITSGDAPRIAVCLDGDDRFFEFDFLGVTIDSNDTEILDAVEGALTETNDSLKTDNDWNYAVRKATNSGNVYIFPKPVAG